MATKRQRSYGDPCGIARALDVVGERWALLVVRELLLGPKRFTDLRAGLPNVGPDVLAQRLRELEAGGVIARRTLAPPAGSRVYELTDRGRGLEPVVLELGRWGSAAPFPPGVNEIGADSTILALKTLFDPASAGDLDARVELRLGEQAFDARVADRAFEVARGASESPDAVLAASPPTLAALLWQGRASPRRGVRARPRSRATAACWSASCGCFPGGCRPDSGRKRERHAGARICGYRSSRSRRSVASRKPDGRRRRRISTSTRAPAAAPPTATAATGRTQLRGSRSASSSPSEASSAQLELGGGLLGDRRQRRFDPGR